MKGKVIDKGHELINKWEEKSREFIANFLELFGKDGRIVSAVNSICPCSNCGALLVFICT